MLSLVIRLTTLAVVDLGPASTVIVASPLANFVIKPVSETVAIASSEDL